MQLNALPKHVLLYVATPYSKFSAGIWPAYKEAARVTGHLVGAGVNAFSPIVHSHPLSVYAKLDPFDAELWIRVDRPYIELSAGLIVVTMNGWRESVGVQAEIREFEAAGKPIWMLNPKTFEVERRGGE